MHFGIRCYPDTLSSEGVKNAIAEIRSFSRAEYVHLSVNSFQKPTPFVSSSNCEGALCFTPDPTFYKDSKIKPVKARQFANVDVLKQVSEVAKRNGMRVYAVLNCLVNKVVAKARSEYNQVSSSGERSDEKYPLMCFNNPSVERYILGLIGDILSNYEVDGIELDTLHYSMASTFRTGNLTCFCRYCRAEARNQGINIDGVKRRLRFFPKPLGEPQKIMEAATSNPFSVTIKLSRSWISLLGLSSWLQHRRHMISEITGRMMITARQTNPDALLGIDLCPPEVSWIAGQDYRALGKNLDCLYPLIDEAQIRKGMNTITSELRSLRRRLGGVMREVRIYPVALMGSSVSPKDTANLARAAFGESDGLVLHAYGETPVENLKAFGQQVKAFG